MSKTPFMPLWVSDFMGKTSDLDAKETGAYLLILMALWTRGGTLPDDQKKLQRIARVGRDWPKVWDAISHYFTIADGEISQQRLSEELHKVNMKREVNSHAGARGGRAKALKAKEQALANATVSLKQPEPYPEERDKSLSKARDRADDFFEEAWKAYQAAPLKAQQTKKLAKAQWPKAVKRAGGAEPILKAIAAEVAKRRQPEEFVPNLPDMHRWLSQDRWNDALEQAQPEPVAEIADDQWRRMLLAWHEARSWPPYAGPQPGTEGCRVPEPILERYLAWVAEQMEAAA